MDTSIFSPLDISFFVKVISDIINEIVESRGRPCRIERLWEISYLGAHGSTTDLVHAIEHEICSKMVWLLSRCHEFEMACQQIMLEEGQMELSYSEQQELLETREKKLQLRQLNQQVMEEIFIMGCQVQWAAPKHRTIICLVVDEMVHALDAGLPIERAVRYMSTESLMTARRILERRMRRVGGLTPYAVGRQQAFQRAADILLNIAKERSLQDQCVVSILQAVKGDARKVHSLSELPEPLKQLFHIPFQELHKKLKQ